MRVRMLAVQHPLQPRKSPASAAIPAVSQAGAAPKRSIQPRPFCS